MEAICADLAAEHAVLDALVTPLAAADWLLATPAEGWAIRDQISHLWFFDHQALLALTDPDAFAAEALAVMRGGGDPSVRAGRELTPAELLDGWRRGRAALLAQAAATDPSRRIAWYGPAMGARAFITARLMETWAHGQDVADALGVQREATARLRHVAFLGVRARAFAYANNGMVQPEADVRVNLVAPDGEEWTWGESAIDVVSGPALDFCLVVTQRRRLADTALTITGPAATEWMGFAQAFAGPPTRPRDR